MAKLSCMIELGSDINCISKNPRLCYLKELLLFSHTSAPYIYYTQDEDINLAMKRLSPMRRVWCA